MKVADHNASQALDLAEAAEILAEQALTAIAGFAQCLERLKYSKMLYFDGQSGS